MISQKVESDALRDALRSRVGHERRSVETSMLCTASCIHAYTGHTWRASNQQSFKHSIWLRLCGILHGCATFDVLNVRVADKFRDVNIALPATPAPRQSAKRKQRAPDADPHPEAGFCEPKEKVNIRCCKVQKYMRAICWGRIRILRACDYVR